MEEFVPFLRRSDDPQPSPATTRRPPEGSRRLAQPRYAARIAVYDDMIAPPRVIVIEPCDITSYLTQIIQTVYQLMSEQGGDLPHSMIRELVENFIHAEFIEPTISILDHGQTLVFSDQGPGIANKVAALKPSFSTATDEMKRYIRGVGSGLPMVESYLKMRDGTMTIEDNLDHGTIVTVSFARHEERKDAPRQQVAPQQQPFGYPATWQQAGYPMPQPVYGYPYGQPVPAPSAQAPQAVYPYVQPAWQGYQQPPQTYPGFFAAPAAQPAAPVPPQPAATTPQASPDATAQKAAPARALDSRLVPVLLAFARASHVGGKELQASLGLSAATASRRLKELEAVGLAAKAGQKYELTQRGAEELSRLGQSACGPLGRTQEGR